MQVANAQVCLATSAPGGGGGGGGGSSGGAADAQQVGSGREARAATVERSHLGGVVVLERSIAPERDCHQAMYARGEVRTCTGVPAAVAAINVVLCEARRPQRSNQTEPGLHHQP